jgi:elongation of very long chain fatty acids protein 4
MASFTHALLVVTCYLAFVFIGKSVMSAPGRKPIDCEPAKYIYNPLQIILCSYMCVEAAVQAYRNDYNVVCNGFDRVNHPVANLLWFFYISKMLDFFDTIFIVLGQKWNQLSVLHVYHHTTIFLMYWLNLRVGYDGDIYLTIILNGFIHTIMYTYYFIAQHIRHLDPKVRFGVIWWKKYLTGAQLVQFLCMNAQAGWMLYSGCGKFPVRNTQIYFGYIQTLFWMFMHFFYMSYVVKKKEVKKA